jgi:hypothetical protein
MTRIMSLRYPLVRILGSVNTTSDDNDRLHDDRDGRFVGKPQSDPETELPTAADDAVVAAAQFMQIAAALHPGVVSAAFSYKYGIPELAYLTRHDGFTMEVTAADGPITSSLDGVTHENPAVLLNQMLGKYPTPDDAVDAGFATTDDGVLYEVRRRG